MQRLQGQSTPVAAIVADPTVEVGMLIKEIVRSLGIELAIVSKDPIDTLRAIESFQADIIIIDDNSTNSAISVMRSYISSPVCCLTPTIVLMNESKKVDGQILATLNRPMVIHKPLSPGRFANGFKALHNVWSQGFFKEIIDALKKFNLKQNDEAMQILIQLTRNSKAQSIVAPAIAALVRQSGNTKVAEKILLAALKISPLDVGVIVALIDLYIRYGMPQTALRLIKSFESVLGVTSLTSIDALQAHLMLNDIDEAIERTKALLAQNMLGTDGRDMLAKLYYCEGRMQEFSQTLHSETKANKIATAWNRSTQGLPTPNTAKSA